MKRYLLLVIAFNLLRVIVTAQIPLSGDEAYYWDCSRHLAWSYFDQPPLVIWAMIPFRALLGEHVLAVRAPAILASVMLALFLIPLMRRLGGGYREATLAYLLLQVMPIFLLGSSYASTDVAMVAAYVAATWAAVALAQGDRRAWWGFGIACGIGFLAKFPVVLVALALIPALRQPSVRADLRTATPYLAALTSLLLTAPVWIWGAQHNWDNIAFQLTGRHSGADSSGRSVSGLLEFFGSDWDLMQGPKHVLEFLGANMALATPFLFVGMVMAFARSRRRGDPGWSVYRWATVTPLAFFFLISLKQRVGGHWGAPALALGIVALAMIRVPARRWLLIGGTFFGLLVCIPPLILVLNPELLLRLPVVAQQPDEEIAEGPIAYLFGAEEVAAEVSGRLATGELVASDSYTLTHLLAFDSGGRFETRLGRVGGGLHGLASLYWHTPQELTGIDALFVTDRRESTRIRLPEIFERCREDVPILVRRRGRLVRRHEVLRCEGLREPTPDFTRLNGS